FNNLHINKVFLPQDEITNLYYDFVVFLCPTRWDSQGVSMCEAMSSGLVLVSNNNTAIPEFITHNISGLLAENESSQDLAYQIERLYYNPDLFAYLSENAASSIRVIADENIVINNELDVIIHGK